MVDTSKGSALDIKLPKPKLPGVTTSDWNTANLGKRLGVDALSAATAGGLVAPLICMIDKGIIENASGKRSISASLFASATTLFTRPHRFLTSKPFLLIFAVYTGTYLTANTLDTTLSTVRKKDAATATSGAPKFFATSAANMSLSLYKDSQFTKMFGTVSARPVPPVTYALFAVRDSLTIFASFNLPTVISPRLAEVLPAAIPAASAAQFLAPAAIQLLSTPFHLLGLDFYNRNGDTKMGERFAKVRQDWGMSSLARMCRIVPAFGVGGVVNGGMRRRGMEGL
ncbi:hypothetical protein B0A48_12137 [Cryoendolithus antarcticus]|uniref:Sequence orphan n=1 Tax=Cryoendolithus antarcticus TaxID=1507870 RepID=A0A1V8SU59_9PEZI|nr:hypothetical protein B0A48_12137 [Cryoendolithus antarcticus]